MKMSSINLFTDRANFDLSILCTIDLLLTLTKVDDMHLTGRLEHALKLTNYCHGEVLKRFSIHPCLSSCTWQLGMKITSPSSVLGSGDI